MIINKLSLLEKRRSSQSLKHGKHYCADYAHAKRVSKDFKVNNLHEYHNLYIQSDTLFSAEVFENFRNSCLEIYKLDPARFLTSPGLAWQVALKKTKVRSDPLTDIDMLIMVEVIRGGIWHAIYWYVKK